MPKTLEQIVLEQEYKDVVWNAFQQCVFSIIKGPVDTRKVHWFYDPVGNTGKSYLCKYLLMTKSVILVDGKKQDVLHQIVMWNESRKSDELIDAVIIDLPRDSIHSFHYSLLETLKNGFIQSGKYEGGRVIFPIPHVIVFANQQPDYSKWSEDRYSLFLVGSSGVEPVQPGGDLRSGRK